jgi:hypothetical protein
MNAFTIEHGATYLTDGRRKCPTLLSCPAFDVSQIITAPEVVEAPWKVLLHTSCCKNINTDGAVEFHRKVKRSA